MLVGVLALQGAFREHIGCLDKLGVRSKEVRNVSDLNGVNALIIPGGESSTMKRLLDLYGLGEAIRSKVMDGMPVFGTCAGAILLAKEVVGEETVLGVMDISVSRNAYGRQVDSFESDFSVSGVGDFHGIFIRAPVIEGLGNSIKVLARLDGRVVMARQDNILVTTFHPELVDDLSIHKYFIENVLGLSQDVLISQKF